MGDAAKSTEAHGMVPRSHFYSTGRDAQPHRGKWAPDHPGTRTGGSGRFRRAPFGKRRESDCLGRVRGRQALCLKLIGGDLARKRTPTATSRELSPVSPRSPAGLGQLALRFRLPNPAYARADPRACGSGAGAISSGGWTKAAMGWKN